MFSSCRTSPAPMPRRLGQTIVVVLVLALGPPVAGAQAGDAPPKPHPAVAAADWRETTEIVLELGDHRYEPNEITLRLGKPYKIVLRNVGNTSHDMVGGSFFDDEVIALRMVSSKAGRVTAQEVTSIYVRSKHDTEVWLVPIREGQYTFYCSLPQHRESGMEGTIKVKR